MQTARERLYGARKLVEAYPGLNRLYDEAFNSALSEGHVDAKGIERQLTYLNRLLPLERKTVLVIGCGPQPEAVKQLIKAGYDAIGVEPVPAFVREAGVYLGAPERVVQGAAESIPLPDRSVSLVYCNSVLEHVDSPMASLREMHRVLEPGGAAFVITTNRFRISASGDNGEYNLPFFNWLPPIVRECFAFHHLHYDPTLANYTDRPAVHWFSFSDLCRIGRDAGFGRFYSPIDLLEPNDPPLVGKFVKARILLRTQTSPWLRALVLTTTYFGGMIIMIKRSEASSVPHVLPSAGTG
jgi:ubiquinone/menaquinone biosynthesis C-methylase UbiE